MDESLLSQVVDSLPFSSRLLEAARRYVKKYVGENDDNPATNGEFRFASRFLPRCSTVFDIGANIGDWTRFALSVKPSLNIHCFEPTPTTFERLRALGLPSNVILNNMGLSSARGTTEIYLYGERDHGMNSLTPRVLGDNHPAKLTGTAQVSLETFDEYCKSHAVERVNFVKIDVEGHEVSVLQGMEASLSARKVDVIQFEYGGTFLDAGTRLRTMFELALPLGGRFYKVLSQGLEYHAHYQSHLENFQYQNWLIGFVPLPLQ